MIRTLIADDDALLRAALRTMVDWEALGYTLVWDCTNGLQMLELLQRTTVDLLITDMKMPLLDGLGLIRRLRQSALLPVTVVLSGYDEYELVQEAFRLGAHDYLLKGNLDTASLTAMLTELRRRSIRSYIVSAIFRRNSIFFRPYGGYWRMALESFDTIFVQNNDSKKLLAELGFDNVVVAGDTRFDRVAEIAAAAKKIDLIERFKGGTRLLIAGSTWGPDEDLLIRLINDNPSVKFIVAPHEMDESRINRLLAETLGGAVRYTQCTAETSFDGKQLLVLDTVGILSSAYGYAEWGYIGGGFGVGIHNTLEAATFGLPIAFGPNYEKFKEARDLVTLGAATPIHSYEELKTWFTPLRDDEHLLQQCSRIAKDYTTAHQGATNIVLHTVFGKPE